MKDFLKKHKVGLIVLFIIIIIIIAIIIFISSAQKKAMAIISEATKSETALVERRDLVSTVAANGTIVAVDNHNVAVNVTGVEFLTIDVEEGDVVSEGDLLCTFDSSTLEQRLADTKATKAASEASANLNLSSAQRMLNEAQLSRDITAEQIDIDIANAWQDYLRALTDVEEAEKNYNDAINTTHEKDAEYWRVNEHYGSLEEAEINFADLKNQLATYMTVNSISSTATATIAIANDDWTYLTSSTDYFIYLATDEAVLNEQKIQIQAYLDNLKNIHFFYANYVHSNSSADADLSGWQSKTVSAESAEKSAKSAYESAVKTAQNYLRTYEQRVRDKQTTLNNSNSSVAAKEESVKSSKISASTVGLTEQETIDNLESEIEKCTVYAPISGTITKINYTEGAGYTPNSTILVIEDESSYQVSAEIDEYDIGKIKEGQKVVIKTNGTGDDQFEGKVAEIASHATTGATSVKYNVKIDILNNPGVLKLDMTAKVSIIINEVNDALTIPFEAVQLDDDGNEYVEVVDESASPDDDTDSKNKVKADASLPQAPNTRKVYIKRGAESDYYIEVIADNLKAGDEVLLVSDEENALENLMRQMGSMGGF